MKVLSILLLTVIAVCASAISVHSHPRGLRVSLGKQRKHDGSMESYKRHLGSLKELSKKATVTLRDVQDFYYYGQMSVGTPEQTIQVNYDSGSADLYVPSRDICKKLKHYCKNHNTYVHGNSSTYQKNGATFYIQYGSGFASGYLSQDTIAIGGLQVTGQVFGEATDMDKPTAEDEYDGILGLSYSSLSEFKTDPPFVNMVKQGVVEKPVFAFYLNKEEPGVSDSNRASELVLGGVDASLYTGNFTFAPVTKRMYWQINVDGVKLGNKKIFSTYGAVPDSGTSIMLGPIKLTTMINKALNGSESPDGSYEVDCSKVSSFPDVSFIISGKNFTLSPSDYILKVPFDSNSNDLVCISGFAGIKGISFLILGDIFMRKFYTQFDMGNNQIGFALAR